MLGGLAVVQGDRRISRFQTQKTGALLAYLALNAGKNHSREALAEMLWPDGDPIAIRNRLNQAISSLRRQLHPPELGPGTVLVTDHHSIGINSQTVSTDVEDFEREIRRADGKEAHEDKVEILGAAVENYHGELLEGYYEEWVFSKRMHVADLYDKALHQLIRSHVALGSPDSAIEYARRRLLLDPYDEAPHVILMRLYLRAGRPKSALKQFEDLERALQRFDEEPSENALKYKSRAEAAANDQSIESEFDDEFDEAPARKVVNSIARVESSIATTLPRVVSSFMGRDRELVQFVNAMRQSDVRLVSVLGLGGCGKTRLAIEAGWRMLDDFQSRIIFVPLASLESAEDLAAEVARILLPGQANILDPFQAIVERLNAFPQSMLILDNFEQLAEDGARFVQDLIKQTTATKLVITTRIPLNVEGESLISLIPLATPEPDAELKDLAANPSIALFVDRAQSVKADFQLTERTAQAISGLIRKLEGLPLALELAASWARVLSPQQMLDQATKSVDLLASRRKDINPRHRSLRAAFDGSFALLDEPLKQAFLKLSYFAGGWDHESATALCQNKDTVGMLQALEERSLIFAEPTDHDVRFKMLETIRSFGESLVSPDHYAECGWIHADYFLSLAELAVADADWIPKIESDYANCLVALRWFQEQEREEEFSRLVIALSRFWENRGMLAEGREWIESALSKQLSLDRLIVAQLKASAAMLDWLAGDFEKANFEIREALATFVEHDAKRDQLNAQFLQQMESHRIGQYEDVKRLLRSNQEIARTIGDATSESRCWLALGNAAIEEGDFDSAKEDYLRSLDLGRQVGDLDRIGSSLANLANLSIYQKHFDQARSWIDETLISSRQSESHWRTAMSLIIKGRLEIEVGDPAAAIGPLIQAYRLAPDEKLVVWRFLVQFGSALLGLGWTHEAFRIFGFMERYRERFGERHRGIEMRLYEERIAALRTPALEEQFQIGSAMSLGDLETILSRAQRNF